MDITTIEQMTLEKKCECRMKTIPCFGVIISSLRIPYTDLSL